MILKELDTTNAVTCYGTIGGLPILTANNTLQSVYDSAASPLIMTGIATGIGSFLGALNARNTRVTMAQDFFQKKYEILEDVSLSDSVLGISNTMLQGGELLSGEEMYLRVQDAEIPGCYGYGLSLGSMLVVLSETKTVLTIQIWRDECGLFLVESPVLITDVSVQVLSSFIVNILRWTPPERIVQLLDGSLGETLPKLLKAYLR